MQSVGIFAPVIIISLIKFLQVNYIWY